MNKSIQTRRSKGQSAILTSSKSIFDQGYFIQSLISDKKTPVFSVKSPVSGTVYAMKVFPYEKDQISDLFIEEGKFANFKHENVIAIKDTLPSYKIELGDDQIEVSYILMEMGILDFNHLVNYTTIANDETLVRTYFVQLISGLEYLHGLGVYHTDLKLENLLVGEDYLLKIIDFGSAFKYGENKKLKKKGTVDYRAPEVKAGKPELLAEIDIYSAGVILYILRTAYLPYSEQTQVLGYDLLDTMWSNPKRFWSVQAEANPITKRVGDDFKELFMGMVKKDPSERWTIDQVKKSKWFSGPVYEKNELQEKVESLIRHLRK